MDYFVFSRYYPSSFLKGERLMKELLITIILLKGISEVLYFGMALCGIVAITLITFLILDRKKVMQNENDI